MSPPPTLESRFQRYVASLGARPPGQRYGLLFGESILVAVLAFLVPWGFGIGHVELGIFCLFFAAISLHGRFAWLLDEHRDLIFRDGWPPRRAHARMAWSVFAVFVGMCVAWAGIVGLLAPASVADIFGYVLEVTGTRSGTLMTRSFGDPFATFQHNLGVMSAVVVLCLVYRSYGAVLVLAWNASTWVVALSTLTRRAAEQAADPWFTVSAVAAVLPHLLLELGGYVVAAMAGIFVSKALTRYDWDDETVGAILNSSLRLLAVATATLFLAAVVEGTLPALVLGR